MATTYNKDTDYQKLIDQAAGSGDYRTAAQLEQQRNAKIEGEGLNYGTTSNYSGWLDKRDYGDEIISAIGQKAEKSTVADLLSSRVSKASGTKGMEQWVTDDIYEMAMAYLAQGSGVYDEYRGTYSQQINDLLSVILNREKFEYDYENDPLYQLYAEQYQREGKRATENAIGAASGSTGGYASSYAVTAAQQAGSYYASKQADKVPELFKLAYDMYIDEIDGQVRDLGLLTKLDETEYNRYRDAVSDLEAERDFEYQRYLDQIGQSNYAGEREYKAERDALSDARYEAEQLAKAEAAAAKAAASGSSGKSKNSSSSSKGKEAAQEESVEIMGMSGSYTKAEAEKMVKTGIVQKATVSGKTVYMVGGHV